MRSESIARVPSRRRAFHVSICTNIGEDTMKSQITIAVMLALTLSAAAAAAQPAKSLKDQIVGSGIS